MSSYVYFLLDRAAMLLKIGFSSRCWLRAAELRVGNGRDLELLGVVRGGREEESVLHEAMASVRERGEWFRVTAETLRPIQAACDADEAAELLDQLERSQEWANNLPKRWRAHELC